MSHCLPVFHLRAGIAQSIMVESKKPGAMQYWCSFESQVWQGIFLPESTFSAGCLSASVQPPVCDRVRTLSTLTILLPAPTTLFSSFSWVNGTLEKGFIVIIYICVPIENPKHRQPYMYHHLGHINMLRTLTGMGSTALAAALPDSGEVTWISHEGHAGQEKIFFFDVPDPRYGNWNFPPRSYWEREKEEKIDVPNQHPPPPPPAFKATGYGGLGDAHHGRDLGFFCVRLVQRQVVSREVLAGTQVPEGWGWGGVGGTIPKATLTARMRSASRRAAVRTI